MNSATNVLHYDCWGTYGPGTSTSTSSSCMLFYNGTSHDVVYGIGNAELPVTQALLDSWGGLSYWATQKSTGRIILILYTEDGAELTVPAHTGASDLVVIWRDPSTRSRAAFDQKYPFEALFNTQTTTDPRPDLTVDGITLA